MAFLAPPGAWRGMGLGTAMGLLSGVAFAGVVMAMRACRDAEGTLGAAWGNGIVAALAIPAAAFSSQGFTAPTLSSGLQILFLGIFQIGLPYFMFQASLRHLRAAEASLLALAEPVACPLWTFLLLDDRPPRSALLGGAIIVGTLVLHSLAVARGSRTASS
jgi:drug/metabolite transporter (DMT)-like permease